jgi:hypothetical protein
LNDDTPLRFGKKKINLTGLLTTAPPVIYKDRDNMTVALYGDGTRAVYPDMEKLGPRFPAPHLPFFPGNIVTSEALFEHKNIVIGCARYGDYRKIASFFKPGIDYYPHRHDEYVVWFHPTESNWGFAKEYTLIETLQG